MRRTSAAPPAPCIGLGRHAIMPARPQEDAMRHVIVVLSAAFLLMPLLATGAPAQPQGMKPTAPMKMTPPGDGEKMMACDKKAVEQKIPMEQHADFVKRCIAEMK